MRCILIMQYAIGIDIGGTKTAIALVDETGVIVENATMPTDLTLTPDQMITNISYEIKRQIDYTNISNDDIVGIGIGAPGPIDNQKGLIVNPPNLQTWTNFPIRDYIKNEFSFSVIFENDANAAALAEKWIGAGQGSENFIFVTVSTGIGAGIVSDGQLLLGQLGNAGDIGHIVIDPSFGQCVCGQYGCLEWIASGTAIARQGSEVMEPQLSTKEVFDLYFQGEPRIVQLIEKVFRVLGVACVNLTNTFDTEKIVIGGGVTQVGKVLFNSIQEYVQQYALGDQRRKTEIVPAQLNQNAGVIGAAALCFKGISF